MLYEQLDQPGTGFGLSSTNPVFSDVYSADDFTVPIGSTWTIRSIVVRGRHASDCRTKAALTPARVCLFTDIAGLPDVVVFEAENIMPVQLGTELGLSLPQPWSLNAGTYWLEVSFETLGNCVWLWRTQATQNGAAYATTTMGPWTPCGGQPSCSSFNPDLDWDLSFALSDAPILATVPTLTTTPLLFLIVGLVATAVTIKRDRRPKSAPDIK